MNLQLIANCMPYILNQWFLLPMHQPACRVHLSQCVALITSSIMFCVGSRSWLQITFWRSFLLWQFFIACKTPWCIGWIREVMFRGRNMQVMDPSRVFSSSGWAEQTCPSATKLYANECFVHVGGIQLLGQNLSWTTQQKSLSSPKLLWDF